MDLDLELHASHCVVEEPHYVGTDGREFFWILVHFLSLSIEMKLPHKLETVHFFVSTKSAGALIIISPTILCCLCCC